MGEKRDAQAGRDFARGTGVYKTATAEAHARGSGGCPTCRAEQAAADAGGDVAGGARQAQDIPRQAVLTMVLVAVGVTLFPFVLMFKNPWDKKALDKPKRHEFSIREIAADRIDKREIECSSRAVIDGETCELFRPDKHVWTCIYACKPPREP